jgi:Ca-activated chloride channel family protein
VLPILITFLVIMVGIAAVYFVGSQAPKKSTKSGKSGKGGSTKSSASRSRLTKERSRFRQTPGWLRKLPLVLVILAVVSLVIAVAQFRVAKSKATPTIALVIDASNSMNATDVQPNRLAAAESAAQSFLQQLPPDFAVSLVSFADEPKVLVKPTTDRTEVANALADLPRGQGTVIGDGLASALDEIETYQAGSQAGPAAIVLLSDGNDTGSKTPPLDAAASAGDRHVPVYTVILGAEKQGGGGGANADLLNQIATSTGAVSATAQTSSELSSVYEKLGSQLSSQLKISSSAQLFVFIAIALAVAAAMILLLTTQRRS